MTTTAQNIIDRAKAFNPLNASLTTSTVEMLSRIRADQQALFTSVAALSRDRFQKTESIASTAAASGRVFALAGTSSPLERVLKLVLNDGREAHEVDILDVDAELAPRYYVQGTSLIEVTNDWSAASGVVNATLTYVYGAVDVDSNGATTQPVSVLDQWIDLLVLPLAMYLHQKDPGRDPVEYERLTTLLDERQQAFTTYLTNYGGVASTRFDIPNPAQGNRKK